MNSFKGTVSRVETSDYISEVTVAVDDHVTLNILLIGKGEAAGYMVAGNEVRVLFKETEVILATENSGVSVKNRWEGTINNIIAGKLISRVDLDCSPGPVSAVIASSSVVQLGLQPGKSVYVMIQANEIMLSE